MTGTEFVEARAKINLYLHVTGRRDDGYHELDSLLVRTTVADRLKFSLHHRDVLEFRSSIGELSPGFGEPDNLVMRAVRILRDASGRTDHIRVELDKSIPVAAGLGGGSADAAATLQAVARMFDWHGSLTELAGSLGADVPACLYAHPVTVSGIGEKIRRTPSLPDCSVVLINPRRPLLTAAVFKRYGGRYRDPVPLTEDCCNLDQLVNALKARRNDLEATAIQLEPSIGQIIRTLSTYDDVRLARMSGSGPTCFGLVEHDESATAIAHAISLAHPEWWSVAATVIST